MVNEAYCSKTQLEVRYPYHTLWREDRNDKFPWIPGYMLQARPQNIFFFCFGSFCQKKNSTKLTCQDTQNELYQLHVGNEAFYEEQSGEQLSYAVLPLLADCLHGGHHQKCSCSRLLFTLCEGGWADHKLVSLNKLLPAVPYRRMDKKRQKNSFRWLDC